MPTKTTATAKKGPALPTGRQTKKKASASSTKKAAPAKVKKTAPKKTPVKMAPVSEVTVSSASAPSVQSGAPKAAPRAHAEVQKVKPKISGEYFYANGKRKTSVASVRLYTGKGTITVNERTFEEFFPVFTDQDKILAPFRITSLLQKYDVSVHVHGGGVHSQAEAVRHGISKALLVVDPMLRTTLKQAGFLTRDSRVKERKKYGLHRARRAPQFSKR